MNEFNVVIVKGWAYRILENSTIESAKVYYLSSGKIEIDVWAIRIAEETGLNEYQREWIRQRLLDIKEIVPKDYAVPSFPTKETIEKDYSKPV